MYNCHHVIFAAGLDFFFPQLAFNIKLLHKSQMIVTQMTTSLTERPFMSQNTTREVCVLTWNLPVSARAWAIVQGQ